MSLSDASGKEAAIFHKVWLQYLNYTLEEYCSKTHLDGIAHEQTLFVGTYLQLQVT